MCCSLLFSSRNAVVDISMAIMSAAPSAGPLQTLEILGGLGGTDCRIVLLFTYAGETCISVICNLICFMTHMTYNYTLIKCRKNFYHYLMGLNIASSAESYSCLFFLGFKMYLF